MEQSLKVDAAIDLGSSSLRAILLDKNGEWHRIEHPKHSKKPDRFSTEEWPILLKVTSDPCDSHIWQNCTYSVTSQTVPAKIAVYFLVEDQLDTFSDDPYCNFSALLEHPDRGALRISLRKGLRELFDAVYSAIALVCSKQCLELHRIILSIPVQWDERFQRYYRDIIKESFGVYDNDQIEFVPEIQAVAHYTFHHRQKLLPNIPKGRRLEILFIDYGGHSLSTCRFFVAYDNLQEKTCFFMTQDPEGVLGGSEQWSFFLFDALNEEAKNCPGRDGRDLPPQARLKLTRDIAYEKCDGWGPEFFEPYETEFSDDPIKTTQHRGNVGRPTYSISISAGVITSCFNRAFHRPSALARAQIKALAEQEIEVLDAKTLAVSPKSNNVAEKFTREEIAEQAKKNGEDFAFVVVSGSSSQNSNIQNAIKRACTAAKIRAEPIFIENGIREHMGLKVAEGAALAVKDVMTIADFIERGAAFGLQRGRKSKVNGQAEFQWDHFAALLICKDQTEVEVQFTSNGDPFRIVCQPFYGHRIGEALDKKAAKCMGRATTVTYLTPNDKAGAPLPLNVSETYDVAPLGEPLLKGKCDPLMEGQPEPLMKGQWRLGMRLDGDQMHFTVHRSPRGEKTFILVDEFATEMSTDVASNCVFFICNDDAGQGRTLAQRFHNKVKESKNSANSLSALPPAETPSHLQPQASGEPRQPTLRFRDPRQVQNSTHNDEILVADSEQPATPSVQSQTSSLVCEEIDAGSTLFYTRPVLQPRDDSGVDRETTNATQPQQSIVIPEDDYPQVNNDQMNYEDLSSEDVQGAVPSHGLPNIEEFSNGEACDDDFVNNAFDDEHVFGTPLDTPFVSFTCTPPQEDQDSTAQNEDDRLFSYSSVSSHGTSSGRVAEAPMDRFPPRPGFSAALPYTEIAFQLADGLMAPSFVAPAQTQAERHSPSNQEPRKRPRPKHAIRTSKKPVSHGTCGDAMCSLYPRIQIVPDGQGVGSLRQDDMNNDDIVPGNTDLSSKQRPRLPKKRCDPLRPLRPPKKFTKAANTNVNVGVKMT